MYGNLRVVHYNSVDNELQHFLLRLERRLHQRPAHALAELIKTSKQSYLLLPIRSLPADLCESLPQRLPVLLDATTSLPEFPELDHTGLIRVYQPLHLPIHCPEAPPLDALPLLLFSDLHSGISPTLLVTRP